MEELQLKRIGLQNSINAISETIKSLEDMDKQLKQELKELETKIRRTKYNL